MGAGSAGGSGWRVRFAAWRRARRREDSHRPDPVPPLEELELPDADAAFVGMGALELILFSREWIHRRVETAEFEDESTVRRDVAVHVTIPRNHTFSPHRTGDDDVCLAPIALLKKRKLTLFEIRDESGAAVSALTRHAGEKIVAAGLVAMARTLVGGDVHDAVRADLEEIASGNAAAAERALGRLRRAGAAVHAGAKVKGAELERAQLLEWPAFHALVWELASNSPVLVPLDHSKGSRRVLRFSYKERAVTARSRRVAFLTRKLLTGPLRAAAIIPTPLRFELPAVGDSGSYHYEFAVPVGLHAVNPRLWFVDHDGREMCADGDDGSYSRVHLAVRHVGRVARAYAEVPVRPRTATVIRAGWLAATFTVLVLVAGGIFLGEVKASPAVTGVLLVATSFTSLYAAGREESMLVTKLTFRLRLLAVLPAACAFVAAGWNVVGGHGRAIDHGWWYVTGVAAAAWMLLTVARVNSRWRRAPRDAEQARTRFDPLPIQ